ncbi:NmrA-like family protein [Aspergillus carlsbadensis]|nr:NmrA-like family protein [Aspergillus carlsbadensis]
MWLIDAPFLDVGREVLDVLIHGQKHQVTVFTRTAAPDLTAQGANVVQVDYDDKDALTRYLRGVHTVLSFIVPTAVRAGAAQKNLIDASIAAGVRRFAPSEWAARSSSGIAGYSVKDEVHDYLKEVNKDRKVLEYCLFQPGMFMNYLSFPYPSTKHLQIFGLQYDLQNRRAIVPSDIDCPMTFTTVQDLAKVVAEAVDHQGEWPQTGGISGSRITSSELIRLAESIRGPFSVETVPAEAIEAGKLNTSWVPLIELPSMPPGTDVRAFSEAGICSVLRGALRETWAVSDEWNKLLPNLKMTTVQEFLGEVWEGKP